MEVQGAILEHKDSTVQLKREVSPTLWSGNMEVDKDYYSREKEQGSPKKHMEA